MDFDRITVDPERMAGVPCIRGSRISVAHVLDMLAEGRTVEGIVDDLPEVEAEDVREALRYAAAVVRDHALLRD